MKDQVKQEHPCHGRWNTWVVASSLRKHVAKKVAAMEDGLVVEKTVSLQEYVFQSEWMCHITLGTDMGYL